MFHHAVKTAGRWRVQQPVPGVFRWRSPLGWFYIARGEPVCPPLPDPLPDPGADVGDVPGLGSPVQDELDEQPLYPVGSEEELEPDDASADSATATDEQATTREPESTVAERAPPEEEPPF